MTTKTITLLTAVMLISIATGYELGTHRYPTGDLNHDGAVNMFDLAIELKQLQTKQ